MKLKRLICCLAIGLGGLSLPAWAADKTGPRVVDSFEVGDNVYVRALKVEKAAGTLWVGTSVGAL